MADIRIGSVAAAQQATSPAQTQNAVRSSGVQESSVADTVNLSSEAKKRLDEMRNSETVAEAFLHHIITTKLQETAESGTDQNTEDKDARDKFTVSVNKVSVDIGWLVDALDLKPDQKDKIRAVILARASVDYVQARPPVPVVLNTASQEKAQAALFVHDLTLETNRDTVAGASVQQVSVARVSPGFAQQLSDPAVPRVVNVAQPDETDGATKAFNDSLTERIATTPSQELQGMLIVRETSASGDTRRLRIDALMPI